MALTTPNIYPNMAMSASSLDASLFVDLLKRMDGLETISVSEDPRRLHPVGSLVDHKDSVRRITRIYDVNADDWFVESDWKVVVVKPWADGKSSFDTKIEWLEDNVLPRVLF